MNREIIMSMVFFLLGAVIGLLTVKYTQDKVPNSIEYEQNIDSLKQEIMTISFQKDSLETEYKESQSNVVFLNSLIEDKQKLVDEKDKQIRSIRRQREAIGSIVMSDDDLLKYFTGYFQARGISLKIE